MVTIEELDDIVTQINIKTIELYKKMNKPIPDYLKELDNQLNKEEKR